METQNFLAILRKLRRKRIDLIVVGGVAGVLQGAPIATFDLDVVHSRHPGNIGRLLAALEDLEAHYRTSGARRKKPDRSHLESPGHRLLMTRMGPLDLLGTIGHGQSYDDLIGDSIELNIGAGLQVHILKLETLIKVKAATAGEKDRLALPILRRTLREKSEK